MTPEIDQTAYRRIIASMGVSEERLAQAERANPDLDWRRLVLTLDGVFIAGGGGMAQSWFWRQRIPSLQGLTPLEALVQPGGVERVSRAAADFSG